MTAGTIGVLCAIAVPSWLLEEPLVSWPIVRLLSPACWAKKVFSADCGPCRHRLANARCAFLKSLSAERVGYFVS
jgi:hypothetical protein